MQHEAITTEGHCALSCPGAFRVGSLPSFAHQQMPGSLGWLPQHLHTQHPTKHTDRERKPTKRLCMIFQSWDLLWHWVYQAPNPQSLSTVQTELRMEYELALSSSISPGWLSNSAVDRLSCLASWSIPITAHLTRSFAEKTSCMKCLLATTIPSTNAMDIDRAVGEALHLYWK